MTTNILNFQFYPVNYYYFPIDRETEFANRVDPKQFPPIAAQKAYYSQNSPELYRHVEWAKNQFQQMGGIFKNHYTQMCPRSEQGAISCHLQCPFIHNFVPYLALKSMENEALQAAKSQLPVSLIRGSAAPQPILQLNPQGDPLFIEDKAQARSRQAMPPIGKSIGRSMRPDSPQLEGQ